MNINETREHLKSFSKGMEELLYRHQDIKEARAWASQQAILIESMPLKQLEAVRSLILDSQYQEDPLGFTEIEFTSKCAIISNFDYQIRVDGDGTINKTTRNRK